MLVPDSSPRIPHGEKVIWHCDEYGQGIATDQSGVGCGGVSSLSGPSRGLVAGTRECIKRVYWSPEQVVSVCRIFLLAPVYLVLGSFILVCVLSLFEFLLVRLARLIGMMGMCLIQTPPRYNTIQFTYTTTLHNLQS